MSLQPNPRNLSVKDHTHSINHDALRHDLNIGWGLVAPTFIATSATAVFSATTTLDFTINNFKVHSSRVYRAHLHGELSVGGLAGTWSFNLMQGSTNVGRMGSAGTLLGSNVPVDFSCLWFPPTGTYTVSVQAEELSGLATVQFTAALRQFWVEDIGKRNQG